MIEKPSFLDLARLLVALIVVVGGGLMLFWTPPRVDPTIIVGVIMLVVGHYFGSTSEQIAQRRASRLQGTGYRG